MPTAHFVTCSFYHTLHDYGWNLCRSHRLLNRIRDPHDLMGSTWISTDHKKYDEKSTLENVLIALVSWDTTYIITRRVHTVHRGHWCMSGPCQPTMAIVGPSGGWGGTRQRGLDLEPLLLLLLLPKGMLLLEMPCLESSANTLSVEGGLSPKGNGSHGLLIASFTTLSTTSSACMHI